MYMSLLGAFEVMLGGTASKANVMVGTPVAGGTRVEVEGLIGFFVNTLVMRGDVSGEPGLRRCCRGKRGRVGGVQSPGGAV